MKKAILFIAVLLLPFSLLAQQSQEFGPKKGDVSLEVLFNPLPIKDGSQYFQLNEYKLKTRYFFNEHSALRVTVGFNMDVKNTGIQLEVPNEDDYSTIESYERAMRAFNLRKNDKSLSTVTLFSVALGYEHHWMVAKRLDIFAGGDFGMGCTAYNAYRVQNVAITSDYKESYVDKTRINGSDFDNSKSKFNVLLGAVSGIDFYVYKGLYLGAELGLYLKSSSLLGHKTIITTTNPQASTTRTVDKYRMFHGGNMNISFNATPLLRLGWLF